MTKKSTSISEYLRKRPKEKEDICGYFNIIAKNKTPMFWNGTLKDGENGSKYTNYVICGSQVSFEQNRLERHWKKYHSEAPEDRVISVEEGENPYDVLVLLMESRSIEKRLKLFL